MLSDELLLAKAYHMVCSPGRCMTLIQGTLERRASLTQEKPTFIWEPIPDLCVPEELENCYHTLQHVDIVSPNHLELCNFFGRQAYENGKLNESTILECCNDFNEACRCQGHDLKIAVRAGHHGCLVVHNERRQWIPAFHNDSVRVIDPTGGGNAFLGGFGVSYVRSKNVEHFERLKDAAVSGSVAASFAIEQVGMPMLTSEGRDVEEWNGESISSRLTAFKQRLSSNQ